jgi:hypothetical protein
MPPIRRDFGALILPAAMYRWRLIRLTPSIWATLSVEYVFILLQSITDIRKMFNADISIGHGTLTGKLQNGFAAARKGEYLRALTYLWAQPKM